MKLEQIAKKNIYQAPAAYFDTLPNVLQQRVRAESKKPLVTLSFPALLSGLRPALAGFSLLLCFVAVFCWHMPAPTSDSLALAAVSKTEALDYLVNTEQLEHQDLVLLSQADQDISYQFIQASPEAILLEVEKAHLEELTLE